MKRLKEREHEAAAAKEREQETGAMFQVEMNNENKKDGSSRWLSTATHIFLFFPAFLVSLLHCRNTLFPFDQLPSGILLFMLLLFSRSFPSQIFARVASTVAIPYSSTNAPALKIPAQCLSLRSLILSVRKPGANSITLFLPRNLLNQW